MTNFYLGIGSNTERKRNITSCLQWLKSSFSDIDVSPIYQSPAFGFDGPPFHNLVVRVGSAFDPWEMKKWLQQLEDRHGRDRSQPRYSNRTLDIDLLLIDDMIIDDGAIQVPRKEITQRNYVLAPLVDIAPDIIHPSLNIKLKNIHFSKINLTNM